VSSESQSIKVDNDPEIYIGINFLSRFLRFRFKESFLFISIQYNARLTRNVLAWLFALFAKTMTTKHCRSLGACYMYLSFFKPISPDNFSIVKSILKAKRN
jgi:hypothetical protein